MSATQADGGRGSLRQFPLIRGSDAEESLATQMRWLGLPEPVREFRFNAERRWRFDFAWPALSVAAEVEGGAWIGGRHVNGAGFENDCEKQSVAASMGWRVLRVTPRQIEDGRAIAWIEAALR